MIYNIGFVEMKYLVSLSRGVETFDDVLPSQLTFELNRQIPSGSKVKLLQFNYNTGVYVGTGQVPTYNHELNVTENGIVVCMDNLMTTNSFTNNLNTGTQTHPILASIPLSTFFGADYSTATPSYNLDQRSRFRQGSYEPQYPCSLDISSPLSVFEISLRSNDDANLLSGDNLKYFRVNFILEIEEDCDCKKNDY